MRHIVATLLIVGTVAPQLVAVQPARPASPSARAGACSLLTKELVTQVTPHQKKALSLILQIPPEEEPVGVSGSGCSYGGVYLQVDPFAAGRFEQLRDTTWVAVSGVGDSAYFRDNKGMWAELYVRAGQRMFTIQMDVPTGATPTSIQPNVVALGKAIVPKLN